MVKGIRIRHFGVGVRIEIPNRKIFGADLPKTYKNKFNCPNFIYDYKQNSKIIGKQYNGMLIAVGEATCDELISFSVLVDCRNDLSKVERMIKILNVLGDDRLIKEKIKIYMSGKSLLNALPELNGLKRSFENLNHIIPNFIENAWFSAPAAKFR